MKFWAIFLLQILLGWLVVQIFLMLIFVFYLALNKGKSLCKHQLPKTAVILCLRGAIILETAVKKVILNCHLMPKLSFKILIKSLLGIPLTQWFYGIALVSSLWMSKVTWRNIVYRIKGPFNILLEEYHPYQLDNRIIDRNISL